MILDPHWSGALYSAAGQGHYRALRGVGARWTRILWRCWQDHTNYNPDLHTHRVQAFPAAATPIAS